MKSILGILNEWYEHPEAVTIKKKEMDSRNFSLPQEKKKVDAHHENPGQYGDGATEELYHKASLEVAHLDHIHHSGDLHPYLRNYDFTHVHTHRHLSEEELSHIHDHTSSSVSLNRALIAKHQNPSASIHGSDAERSDVISGAIKNQPKTTKSFHVYTAVGDKFRVSDLRAEGHEEVHLPAFTSTSVHPRVTRKFATSRTYGENPYVKEHIRIKIPKGTNHGVYVGKSSMYPDEHEYLLDKGKTIRFKGKPKKINMNGHVNIIHDAEIVE